MHNDLDEVETLPTPCGEVARMIGEHFLSEYEKYEDGEDLSMAVRFTILSILKYPENEDRLICLAQDNLEKLRELSGEKCHSIKHLRIKVLREGVSGHRHKRRLSKSTVANCERIGPGLEVRTCSCGQQVLTISF